MKKITESIKVQLKTLDDCAVALQSIVYIHEIVGEANQLTSGNVLDVKKDLLIATTVSSCNNIRSLQTHFPHFLSGGTLADSLKLFRFSPQIKECCVSVKIVCHCCFIRSYARVLASSFCDFS